MTVDFMNASVFFFFFFFFFLAWELLRTLFGIPCGHKVKF